MSKTSSAPSASSVQSPVTLREWCESTAKEWGIELDGFLAKVAKPNKNDLRSSRRSFETCMQSTEFSTRALSESEAAELRIGTPAVIFFFGGCKPRILSRETYRSNGVERCALGVKDGQEHLAVHRMETRCKNPEDGGGRVEAARVPYEPRDAHEQQK